MLAAYAVTSTFSALLLFLVQPMFAKMVLPSLGGTPAVWNTCMVFFQATLLAGYAYAHLGSRWLTPRVQAALHLVLLAASLLALPIWPRDLDPGGMAPVPWLIGLLAASLGIPFFMLAASAPMLQRWFAASGHPHAGDPYFLYAASNLGSLAALIGYPLLVEPMLPLREQSHGWSLGYGLLVLLVGACAWLQRRRAAAAGATPPAGGGEPAAAGAPVTAKRRARWVLLAFAPSSLMLGLTTYATTDIAAVPLLWVVPLTLYLLTFVLTFARRPPVPHRWILRAQPLALVAVAVPLLWGHNGMWLMLPLHVALFFVCAMACHGELAGNRPAARHLTEFYLWMALGGVLGGMFNALLAPVLFDAVLEYPIAVALACMMRPAAGDAPRRWPWPVLAALAAGGLALLADAAARAEEGRLIAALMLSATAGSVWLLFAARRRPLAFGVAAGVLFAGGLTAGADGRLIAAERSFFGVHRVTESADGAYRLLHHGTTVHGAQARDPQAARQPLTYYHRQGPLGAIFAAVDDRLRDGRIGAVGLGAGAVACYGKAGQRLTFFEIDPLVAALAMDPAHFTYLTSCGEARPDLVLGDARLTLAREADGSFDLLILDAFSSDAIPLHLLTREAMQLYLQKLAPGGVLAFHISNRYVDLAPTLSAIVHALGGAGRLSPPPDPEGRAARMRAMQYDATFAAVARSEADLGALATAWQPLPAPDGIALWTDDYSNILQALRWRRTRGE